MYAKPPDKSGVGGFPQNILNNGSPWCLCTWTTQFSGCGSSVQCLQHWWRGDVGTIVPKKTKYGWTTSLFQDTTFKLLQCLGPRPSKPLLRSKLGFGFSFEPIHLGKLVNSWLQSVGHHQAIHISVSKLAWKASRAGLRSRKDAYRW